MKMRNLLVRWSGYLLLLLGVTNMLAPHSVGSQTKADPEMDVPVFTENQTSQLETQKETEQPAFLITLPKCKLEGILNTISSNQK